MLEFALLYVFTSSFKNLEINWSLEVTSL